LLIAMLASWPLRLRNVAELRIGIHLIRDRMAYLVMFKDSEVKNRKRLEWRYPDDLTSWIDRYLERHRPALAGDARTDRFWIRQDGGIFTPEKLLLRLSRVTKRAFGVAFTTRFFRYSGATAIFEQAPEDTGMASALLGHKNLSTARRHYIHPATNLAIQRYADLIIKISK
jgi:integrase